MSQNYTEKNERLLTTEDAISAYVNVPRPFTAKLVTENENLQVAVDGAIVHVKPTKEAYYSDCEYFNPFIL